MEHAWLRWAGSKWRALPALRSMFENRNYDLYVEPFVGAATIFFRLVKPVNAVLADSNRDLIAFYRFIKDDPNALWKRLLHFPQRVSKNRYERMRKRFNSLPQGLERAATFFFLNRMCFNGIYRINRFGEFNVPIGSRREFRHPSLEALNRLSSKLQRARILDCDFARTARHARRGAFYYLDPPYTDVEGQRSFDRYSWPPFRRTDLDRLGDFIHEVVQRGADVAVSYSGSRRPGFVPLQFKVERFTVYRSISSDGTRGRKVEICAYSWQEESGVSVSKR